MEVIDLVGELEARRSALQHLLSTYFDWYKFFWTVNVAALAWVYTSTPTSSSDNSPTRRAVARLFGVVALAGALTSFLTLSVVLGYHRHIARLYSAAVSENVGSATVLNAIPAEPWPGWFTMFAFLANGLATLLIAFLWLWLAGRGSRPARPVSEKGDSARKA